VTKTDDAHLAKFLGVSRTDRGKHSKLYYWLRENYAAIGHEFDRNGAQWPKRVEVLAELGLTDHAGKSPTIKTAQQTWYRVCRDVERTAASRPAPSADFTNAPAPASTASSKASPESVTAASKPANNSPKPASAMPQQPESGFDEEEPVFRTAKLKTYEE
jgi:hypothetical protein